jgi:hypothetical protein
MNMADITYHFSIDKTAKARLNVLGSVLRALWTGKFVIKTPDLQPNIEPMDFSEANFKEMKRQRNHFANQNALLRKKLSAYGGSHATNTGRPLTEKEREEIDAVFAQADKAFDEADKAFSMADAMKTGVRQRSMYRKYDI